MPNWCGCYVEVTGNVESIAKFKADADTIGCNKYHASKDDELTKGEPNG